MQYLIDTCWVIHAQKNHAPVVDRLEELAPTGIGISIISVAELYDGVFGSSDNEKSERELKKLLNSFEVLPLDEETCRIFARERARLRTSGNLIGDLDLLIGATAIRHNLTILSNNRRHFARLEGLSIISV